MKKPILVTGANGQLGHALAHQLESTGHDCVPVKRSDLDITDEAAVKWYVDHIAPSVVVNAAAYTAVDKAEADPESAFAVNASGPAHLAAICRSLSIPLIHYSTDYVFDGNKSGAYVETDPVAPRSVYGRSKAAGEAMIREILPRHLIIRTAWLYGLHGSNFVKTMLKVGKTHDTLRVVEDQIGCPTYAGDLAAATIRMIDTAAKKEREVWGTYHYCNGGATSWHGFASEIFRLARQYPTYTMACRKIAPIPSSAYPTAARRPLNSVLDCGLVQKTFGLSIPHWTEALARVMPEVIARL